MATRRQHTVWRNYLRAWAQDGKIWCAMDGKVFRAALMNVGQERDFYEIRDLMDSDVDIIRKTLIDAISNPIQKKAASDWLPIFQMVSKTRKHFEDMGIDASEALRPMYIQLEELLHSEIERNATPLLERLLVADRFCLDGDKEYGVFVHYVMTQYFRTSRIKQNLQRGIGDLAPDGYVDRAIGVIRHICATASAITLISSKNALRPYLVLNGSGVPFITGDQPVINIIAAKAGFDTLVDDCEFYYPLSPGKALFISRSDDYSSGWIKDSESVKYLNRLIARSAEKQIYASDESEFGDCAALVGSHLKQKSNDAVANQSH
ncbi:MAG: DUF4238 domain-containing protein [Gammaproteobacteria bacterium]